MSESMTLFGPSQEKIWRRLAREVGGRFHEGGILSSHAVQARADDWLITLDIHALSEKAATGTVTRLRAPYFNPEGFRFEIYRATFFTRLWRRMGMMHEDIEVGHPRFDRDFVIKGNAPGRVRRLFDSERIRRLIDAQPRIRMAVKSHEGVFSKFPARVDELHFEADGTMKDLRRLRLLFDLFAEVLRELCHEGKAYEDDVRINVRRLRAPGGQVKDRHVIWEGDAPRRDAAEALGRLGDPVAGPALASVLKDKDTALVERAVDALARIGDARAIGPLVRRLGEARTADDGRPIRDHVADALRHLGEGVLVDAVLAAFDGDLARLKAYDGKHRKEIIDALCDSIRWRAATHPANALAEIHAVEALPRLRAILSNYGRRNPTGLAIAAAIAKLEARASLPRAAAAADVEADTLPRAAGEPGPGTDTLPRRALPQAPGNR